MFQLIIPLVGQLYWDLDGGFTEMAWLLHHGISLPSFRRRDDARLTVKELFYQVIKTRKTSNSREDDILQTLIDLTYIDANRKYLVLEIHTTSGTIQRKTSGVIVYPRLLSGTCRSMAWETNEQYSSLALSFWKCHYIFWLQVVILNKLVGCHDQW